MRAPAEPPAEPSGKAPPSCEMKGAGLPSFPMLPNFTGPVTERGRSEYQRGFVREVQIAHTSPRNRRFERLLVWFWVVIAAKCAGVWWVMRHFRVPIHPLWVVVPTVMFAAVCTAVYIWRD